MCAVSSKRQFPEFEKPLLEINEKIIELTEKNPESVKIKDLVKKKKSMTSDIYAGLTPWQKVQLARHPARPYTLDYINGIFTDFIEFHGDRRFGDDRAIVGGIASLDGDPVMVIGHQKGRTMEESLMRNFGMPHPEGYRKSLRLMKMAEKFSLPVITFIDTPGAFPGVKAEERGQSEAIATNLKEMSGLRTPIIVVIVGEGGSGGALGIAVGDRMIMLEYAVYFVCTPEACSAILWRDSGKAELAAETMRLTSQDLLKLGVVDEIVKEPHGGAHWDHDKMFDTLKERLQVNMKGLKRTKPKNLIDNRYKKFRNMGVYSK